MEKYNLLASDEYEAERRPPFATRAQSYLSKHTTLTLISLLCNVLLALTIALLLATSVIGPPYGAACYLPTDVLWGRKGVFLNGILY